MAYDLALAERVLEYFSRYEHLEIEAKEMFGGLCLMVNDKMCVIIGDEDIMVRFDPADTDVLSERPGFQQMVMKGRVYKGYGRIAEPHLRGRDLAFWLEQAIAFNARAKSSRRRK